MKHMKKAVAFGLSLVMATSLLTACGPKESAPAEDKTPEAAATSEKHMNFGCYNYSDSLDPATNVNSSWCGVRYGITECLFKFDEQVVAQPNLVDEVSHTDDYTAWTFHVKDDLSFSNGNPVNASAVKNSIERLFQATDADQGGKGNSNPEGYLTYTAIDADDESGEVTIHCEGPTANLPGILAYPYFAIIDTTVVDDEIIGTGPYKVDETQTGISLELSRNEHYHNGEVPLDTMTIFFIDDSSTKSMALQSGDIDVVENITTASDLEKLSADDAYYIDTAAGVRTGNSYMNYHGVLGNDALRQAIVMAIDNQTLCDVVVGGMYTNGISVLPSSLDYGYDTLTNPYPYDVEKANKLLDDAGIVDGDGDGWREVDGQNIDLNYIVYTGRNLNDFAEAIAIQMAEIGVKMTVNVRDYDTALALQNAGEFDLITSNSITVGVGDPQDFMGNWYSKNAVNYGYYESAEYDALYEALLVETDGEARKDIVAQLQQILIDDACSIVHGYYNSRMFSNASKIEGATIATIDYYWITTDMKVK